MDTISSFLNDITKVTTPKVYSKKILSNNTKKKLLSYQESNVVRIINILLLYNVALDGSDTGVGKTYMGAAVCKELKRRPVIMCPKTLIFNWQSILEYFGIEAYDIVNYETLKHGRTYTTLKYKSIYQWKLPKDAILIIDESHRCKNPKTDNGKLLMSTRQAINNKIPVLILSATICEKFTDMRIPFYLFGFIPNTRNFNHYVRTLKNKYPNKIKRSNYQRIADYQIARDNAQAMIIFEEIKDYIARIRIRDLGDKFPVNQWCAQQFIAEESDKISEAYEEIATHMLELKNNPGQNQLAQIQK